MMQYGYRFQWPVTSKWHYYEMWLHLSSKTHMFLESLNSLIFSDAKTPIGLRIANLKSTQESINGKMKQFIIYFYIYYNNQMTLVLSALLFLQILFSAPLWQMSIKHYCYFRVLDTFSNYGYLPCTWYPYINAAKMLIGKN